VSPEGSSAAFTALRRAGSAPSNYWGQATRLCRSRQEPLRSGSSSKVQRLSARCPAPSATSATDYSRSQRVPTRTRSGR